jgi:four helix bundle protein
MGEEKTPLKSYRELEVWKKARVLVKTTYKLTDALPKNERYGLISQMRSAVISVPGNIAEGYGRIHGGDYIHHLSMARGSLYELETYLILVVDLEYLSKQEIAPVWKEVNSINQMLSKLILSLKNRGNQSGKKT